LSTFGRRGSRESGWNWSHPPGGARPPSPPPQPPLPPLAGAALLFAAIAAALLAFWLAGGDEGPPQDATATPVASATATRTPTPAPTATATPIPSPTPAPTPTPTPEPGFSLAIWNRGVWQSEPAGQPPKAFWEGQAVPFMLRIADARAGPQVSYALIRYTCKTVQFLSGFDSDSGSGPALAPGGPQAAVPDSTVAVPDDPATPADDSERGRLSLWGGSFLPVQLAAGTSPEACERSLNIKLAAGRDELFLLWGAVIAPGAAKPGLPLRITVVTSRGERSIEIDPVNIVPVP